MPLVSGPFKDIFYLHQLTSIPYFRRDRAFSLFSGSCADHDMNMMCHTSKNALFSLPIHFTP